MPTVKYSPNPVVITGLLLFIGFITALWFLWQGAPNWSWYGAVVAVLLGGKVLLSLLPSQKWPSAQDGIRVGVAIPLYNEDPSLLQKCLQSIADQTYPVKHIVVIDDGSDDSASYDMARLWARTHLNVTVLHQLNAGKREALAVAFRTYGSEDVDVWCCVDSDTILEPTAIAEGLAPLGDPRIAAVTGVVVAANPRSTFLARLIDLRYTSAFLVERSAYSRFGAVLCVCGSLAFWRSNLVVKHLDGYLGETFMGVPSTYGDDRHMTNRMLTEGRVVIARKSIARTAVPERLGHFLRQQQRWSRSFFKQSAWAFRNLSPKSAGWWLTVIEGSTWVALTAGIGYAVVVAPFIHESTAWLDYAVWAVVLAYVRSVHVFSLKRTDMTRWQQMVAFLLSPFYAVVQIFLVLPLRLWALATLKESSWGTRARVEVEDSAEV